MRARPVFLVMLMICALTVLFSTVFGGVSAQGFLVDNAAVTGGTPGNDYEFRVLPWNPAVIGVRPTAGDDFDIEVHGEDLIEGSDSTGSTVDFVVIDGNTEASTTELGTSVIHGTGYYEIEMENDIEAVTLMDSWVGSVDVSLGGPVLNFGSLGSWDDEGVYGPSVVYDGTTFHMWYTGYDGSINKIGYATSENGIEWVKHQDNPVLTPDPGEWDGAGVSDPTVLYEGGTYHMWYTGDNGAEQAIGHATSTDGVTWTKDPRNPVLDGDLPGPLDYDGVSQPSVLHDGTKYHMWYAGLNGSHYEIGYASSLTPYGWEKLQSPVIYPVLDLNYAGTWDDAHVCGPSVIYAGSTYHMWYGGCCGSYTRTGYATSDNGIIWTKYPANPVLDMGSRGTWDDMHSAAPTVLFKDSTYHMWYSGHDGKNYRIGYATSPNRFTWTKLTSSPEVLDAYKIANVEVGSTYIIKLAVPSTADLDMFIFDTTGGRDDALASSTNRGRGVDESITFTAQISGEYILLITNEDSGTGTYTVLAKSPPVVKAGGNRIANDDGSIYFEAEAYYPGLTQNPKKYPAWAVDISGNGQHLAVSWDKNVTFFSTASSVPLWTLDTQDIVHDLKLSDNGQYLAVLSNKTLYFFDTGTNVPLWSFNIGYYGGLSPGNQLDMTRDGKFIACSARGNRVLVFDCRSEAPAIPHWDYDFGDEVKVVKFSGDGRYLAMGGLHSHEFQIGWIPGRDIKWTYVSQDVFYSASFSYDGSIISQGQGNQHNVSVFNSDSNTPEWSYGLEGAQFEQVMSDDGQYFASSNHWDSLPDTWNGIAFWNTTSSTPVWTYETEPGYYSRINAVDMDRNAKYVVGGCLNNDVYLFSQLSDGVPGWDLTDGEPIFKYSTEGWIRFNGVSMSADGNYFAAASWDGSVYLFSTVGATHLAWSWNPGSSAPASVECSWDFDASVDSNGDGIFTNDVDAEGPNPTHIYDEYGVYTVTLTVTAADGTASTHTIIVTVDSVPPTGEGGELFRPGLALAAAAIIAALLICLIAGSTEVGKLRWIPIISPLYSRLKKDEVLDQFTRGRIYEHIRKNPGDHYNSIKQELELNNGALAYHLHTLQKENYIKSKRDGIYKRFFPVGMKIPDKRKIRLSEVEKDIMDAIRRNPGATQKTISRVLKISQQVVSYHVKLMTDAGLIIYEKHDRKYRYFINGIS